MPNAKDASSASFHKLLVLGKTGAGKTQQMFTLPGCKFAYLFDPAAMLTLRGLDLEYEEFLPDVLEMDATLKGFNKDSKDDKMPLIKGQKVTEREPTVYMRWVEDINKKADSGFFDEFDWLCIDSLTLLASAVMDRNMWLNKRYGGLEELSDYRVVGSKIASVFQAICALKINLYCTGHISSFQDEKTKRIEYQINLPGKSRTLLPLLFSNIWEARATQDDKAGYIILTKPEARGFQDIRTTIKGLKPTEDVTIDLTKPPFTNFGIGKILRRERFLTKAEQPKPAVQPEAKAASTPATPAASQPSGV